MIFLFFVFLLDALFMADNGTIKTKIVKTGGVAPTANNEQRVSTPAHLPLFSINVCMAFPIVMVLGMLSFVSHKSSSLVPQIYEKIC